MLLNDREQILALTREWKGERYENGRPKVSDEKIEILKTLTQEEIWHPLYACGYRFQFQGNMRALHEDKKLYGRAVTCCFMPQRPDMRQLAFDTARAKGWKGDCNQWVIDSLRERDVVVADMYDKIYKGTFLGGNLTIALHNRTKTGGAVVWGGVRDVEQMKKVPDVQVYYRGIDPTPIREFVMKDWNDITAFGGTVCLPGDVVFGAGGGVLFIPSHLVADVVEGAAKTHVKDDFGFEMICQGRFTTAQIDKNTWSEDMLDLLLDWIKSDPRGEAYRDLDWSKEYDLARNGDPTDTQTAL